MPPTAVGTGTDGGAMPLTQENVAMVRAAVAKAKIAAQKPETVEDYLRFARQVYVVSWAGAHAAAATTEAALAAAKTGNDPARQYLTVMVYDIQLQAAMVGAGLSTEEWRTVYVGSGIMTDRAFTAYMTMAKSGRLLP